MGPRATARRASGRSALGFVQAPQRGKAHPGVGKIRNAVERCQNFFAQFGRVFRRCDRSSRRYLGWLELAACIILLRSGFVS
jgi:transposase